MENNKKPKNITKYILVSIIVIAIIAFAIYMITNLLQKPADKVVIEKGTVSEEESTQGYVIRDEEVITGQNYKNGMLQIKTEGERVAKGDPIFRYYTNNEQELLKQIQELDVQIQEAMENENTPIFNTDIKLIEEQIAEQLNNLHGLNNLQKIKEYKKEIDNLVTKKAKIAGDLSPAGSYLRSLVEQRSNLENQLNTGSEYVNAPRAGVVSYRVDGLEAVLTPDSFSSLNSDFLEGLNLKTGELVTTSAESGKIVNNFQCYIACVLSSEEAKNAVVGEKVTLRLSNQTEVEAEIEYTYHETPEKIIIVFQINNAIEELINYRKISLDVIWWQATGWKVPNSAIQYKAEDLAYVVRKRSGYSDNVYVKILKQNGNYSIIDNYTYSELSEKLEELNIEENIETRPTLSLYDEVLI